MAAVRTIPVLEESLQERKKKKKSAISVKVNANCGHFGRAEEFRAKFRQEHCVDEDERSFRFISSSLLLLSSGKKNCLEKKMFL